MKIQNWDEEEWLDDESYESKPAMKVPKNNNVAPKKKNVQRRKQRQDRQKERESSYLDD